MSTQPGIETFQSTVNFYETDLSRADTFNVFLNGIHLYST